MGASASPFGRFAEPAEKLAVEAADGALAQISDTTQAATAGENGELAETYDALTHPGSSPQTNEANTYRPDKDSVDLYRAVRARRKITGMSFEASSLGAAWEDLPVILRRALSPGEFDDIFNIRGFRPKPGGESMDVKQFGLKIEEIMKLANSFPDTAAVVRARVPKSLLSTLDLTPVDPTILRSGSVSVQPDMLEALNKSITELEQAF